MENNQSNVGARNYRTREEKEKQNRASRKKKGIIKQHRLIKEPTVLILSKERLPNDGESINLQQSQTLLKGIVDFDLTLSTNNNHTTSAVQKLAHDPKKIPRDQFETWSLTTPPVKAPTHR